MKGHRLLSVNIHPHAVQGFLSFTINPHAVRGFLSFTINPHAVQGFLSFTINPHAVQGFLSFTINPHAVQGFWSFTISSHAVQGFLAEGLQRTTAGLGSVIIDSQPLTVAVLAALLFGEKLTAASYAGLGLGVLGLSLLEVPVDVLTAFPQKLLGKPLSKFFVCNVWDAHMGSATPMTATAVPFHYTVHSLSTFVCVTSVNTCAHLAMRACCCM
jgi:drug/metabolite transporter (DMT)-like permease